MCTVQVRRDYPCCQTISCDPPICTKWDHYIWLLDTGDVLRNSHPYTKEYKICRWETRNYRVTVRTCCPGYRPVFSIPGGSPAHSAPRPTGAGQPSACLASCPGGCGPPGRGACTAPGLCSCAAGWTGPACEEACPPGAWGPGCRLPCQVPSPPRPAQRPVLGARQPRLQPRHRGLQLQGGLAGRPLPAHGDLYYSCHHHLKHHHYTVDYRNHCHHHYF
jgi:hypothetical protein